MNNGGMLSKNKIETTYTDAERTLQTMACMMASNPPSGPSKLPETGALFTSSAKRDVLRLSAMWFLNPYGASHLSHGRFNLRNERP